eukprot:Seg17282.1 transcript_id=Seg17282.1/GoldUCD/mRNA.D3Y31 product="hypothetical protein" protein_id=Seg17282.1/GoldUCD/D3Y31
MPQGQQISGEDGIVLLKNKSDGTVIGEIPCLTNWTLTTSASLSERGTKCMKSNGDGGSDSSGGWTNSTVESRSWNVSLEFYFQDAQDIPASVKLDPTNVGDEVILELFPNDNATGKVMYSGTAIIETAPVTSAVADDMKVTAELKGSGELTKAVVA